MQGLTKAVSSPPPRGRRWSAATAAVIGLVVCVLFACAACGRRGQSPPEDRGQVAPERVQIDVFALGRVLGTIAPCGCTTEPLGGLQYLFGFIEDSSQAKARVVVAPGSFLLPDPGGAEAPVDEAAWAQARRRASVLRTRFAALGTDLVMGLGPMDLVAPHPEDKLEASPLPRVLANGSSPTLPTTKHKLVTVTAGPRAIKVGVTAVVDPSLPHADKVGTLHAPAAAAAAEVEAMRSAGAELTIVIVEGPRALAETVARDVDGLDLVVVGHVEGVDRARLGAPAARIGDTYVIEPGEQLQTVTHVTLAVDPNAQAIGGVERWHVEASKTDLSADLQRVEARLQKFGADPGADPAFLAQLETERARLQAKLAGGSATTAPVAATFEQVKITCKRAVDKAAQSAIDRYDRWVAEKNRERFADVRAPAPAKGEAGYSGIETCDTCHDEAVAMWRETVHGRAFETLVDLGKELDLSCVGCHVTGFRKPGGSEVVRNEGLRDVQCEVCHGPGSKHAESEEEVDIVREAPVEVCQHCHTPEHSDTFEYSAYLRDILGPGHGENARKALGEGPTGAELRKAGLEKAGGACKKM